MKIVKLNENVAVSEQIRVEVVDAIAAAGYKVLVNNRPDGEAPDQPGSAEIATAAKDAGLSYYYLPVTATNFPGPDADRMADLLNSPDQPVLAFCRTGTRCTNLWVSTREDDGKGAAVDQARALGYDLSMSGNK
jgi:uncharacterized protein (TIGR01244 family)